MTRSALDLRVKIALPNGEGSLKNVPTKRLRQPKNFPLDQTQSQISLKATQINNHKTTTFYLINYLIQKLLINFHSTQSQNLDKKK
jgi:hypothetical protein